MCTARHHRSPQRSASSRVASHTAGRLGGGSPGPLCGPAIVSSQAALIAALRAIYALAYLLLEVTPHAIEDPLTPPGPALPTQALTVVAAVTPGGE